ncbi:MAG: hypothetical protein ACQJCO_01735 [cyanobacterium endosymbiont of Rhopalodia sterrenbergii]
MIFQILLNSKLTLSGTLDNPLKNLVGVGNAELSLSERHIEVQKVEFYKKSLFL